MMDTMTMNIYEYKHGFLAITYDYLARFDELRFLGSVGEYMLHADFGWFGGGFG